VTARPGLPAALAILVALAQEGCGARRSHPEGVAPTPIDTTAEGDRVVSRRDTVPSRTNAAAPSDSSSPRRDSVPAQGAEQTGPRVSPVEYEGWRQYSANCARCHGQDVLPNPVAANLLASLAQGGPINSEQTFAQVVINGRPDKGMPAFKGMVTPDQTSAIYAYVKGRADKRIPPGRPEQPS